MIIEYIRYKISKEMQEQFDNTYNRAEEVQREPSLCLKYDLSHCIEKPEPYALRIEWDSRDGGHMKGFQNNQVSNILIGS
jgi:quinol monooxygenase YgiN